MRSNTYTYLFALIVCLVCSLSLALIARGLKSRQDINEQLDIKKNILKAVKLEEPVNMKATADEILNIYRMKIEEVFVDAQGEVHSPGSADLLPSEDEVRRPLYIYKENGKVIAYCFPVIGKGLWSTLYGYLALEPDATTVRGITFYKHGETPGLGAEIEKEWFQKNFQGKKILDVKGDLAPVAVVKGKVADKYSGAEAAHYVDGISGATITSRGVTDLVRRGLEKYEPFFKNIRKRA